jgi:hypothetical protein
MNSKLLLPHRFKTIGWIILIPITILGIIAMANNFEPDWLDMRIFALFNDDLLFGGVGESGNFKFIETNVTLTLIGALFIVGAMMVGFSKEKMEDEFIAKIRLSSLLWSVWVNYALLFLAFIFVYGMSFFDVMIFNMFTVLIIFIVRFNYILWRSSKSMADDK